MATEVDKLLIRVEADLKDLKKDMQSMERTVSNSSDKAKKSLDILGKVGFAALGAVAVRATASVVMSSLQMASSIEEMQNKSSVVFGQFSDDFRQFTDDLAKETARSRFDLERMGSQIQDTFVPMGFARGEATELSKQLVKLAVDVGSFNDVADVEVMRAFQSALVGNHETVRQFGILITEATLAQELLRMGLDKTTKEATAQEKVQARMNIIFKGTTDAVGDAANTADSFANKQRALSAAIQDLQVTLGQQFMPAAKETVTVLTDLTNATRDFIEGDGKLKEDSIAGTVLRTLRLLASVAPVVFNPISGKDAAKREAEQLEKLQQGIGYFNEALKETRLRVKARKEAHERMVEVLIEENDVMAEGMQLLQEMNDAFDLENIDAAIQAQEDFKDMTEAIIGEIAALTDELNNLSDAELAYNQIIRDNANLTQDQKDQIRELINEREALSDAIEKQSEVEQQAKKTAIENAKKIEEEQKKAQEKIIENSKKAEEEQRKVQEQIDEIADKIQNKLNDVSDSFVESMLSGESAFSSFKDMFANIAEQILKEAFKLLVIEQIMARIRGAMGATGGGGGGLFSFGSLVGLGSIGLRGGKGIHSPLGSGATNAGPVQLLAGGGSVQRGRPTIVGERGAELFIPSSVGTIMNNMNAKNAIGGGNPVVVNQNLNFAVGVTDTVKAEVMNMMPLIRNTTMQAVADSRQRGGTFADSLSG